jgi:hypothetical protein
MRNFVLLLLLTACGETVPGTVDMSTLPECPVGVDDAMHPIACDGTKDTECHAPLSGIPQGQTCRCLCGRYWECDLVFALCDGGAHD